VNTVQENALRITRQAVTPVLMTLAQRKGGLSVLDYKPPDALLRRYMAENKTDLATAKKAFMALKQFLFVCATAKHSCSPSIAIDAMWHEFLMFSKEYYNFCLQYFGTVVHHHPTEVMMNESYRNTRDSALKNFGKLDRKFWPKSVTCVALCSGGECSAGCESSN